MVLSGLFGGGMVVFMWLILKLWLDEVYFVCWVYLLVYGVLVYVGDFVEIGIVDLNVFDWG